MAIYVASGVDVVAVAVATATGYLQWLSNCLIRILHFALLGTLSFFAGTPNFVFRLKTFNNFMKSRRQTGDADCNSFAPISLPLLLCTWLLCLCTLCLFCMRSETWRAIVSCHLARAHFVPASWPLLLVSCPEKQKSSCCSLGYCMRNRNAALIAQV